MPDAPATKKVAAEKSDEHREEEGLPPFDHIHTTYRKYAVGSTQSDDVKKTNSESENHRVSRAVQNSTGPTDPVTCLGMVTTVPGPALGPYGHLCLEEQSARWQYA